MCFDYIDDGIGTGCLPHIVADTKCLIPGDYDESIDGNVTTLGALGGIGLDDPSVQEQDIAMDSNITAFSRSAGCGDLAVDKPSPTVGELDSDITTISLATSSLLGSSGNGAIFQREFTPNIEHDMTCIGIAAGTGADLAAPQEPYSIHGSNRDLFGCQFLQSLIGNLGLVLNTNARAIGQFRGIGDDPNATHLAMGSGGGSACNDCIIEPHVSAREMDLAGTDNPLGTGIDLGTVGQFQ